MKSDATRSRYSRWPVILAILTTVTGLYLSLHFRSRIEQIETNAARLTAETLRLNTEQELALFVEVLESVRALHALSDAVDQAAMDEFIQKGLVHQHDVLGAFGLAQRISPHVRSLLEKEAAEQGTGYRVVQQGSDGTWIPSEPKAAYYPLTWQSRTEELCMPVGFDFASEPAALQTIQRVEQTRRTALVQAPVPEVSSLQTPRLPHSTTPTPLLPSPLTSDLRSPISDLPAYWVFAPVMPRNNPNTVIGFSAAILKPDAILKRVAARSALSPTLHLNLISPAEFNPGETIRLANNAWLYRHPLEAMGAQWMFECALPVTGSVHRSTTALVIGLIITALMTSQLLILGTRTKKIEAEVLSRTEELRIANVHLEENLRERARMEEEMNELATRERRKIGRDLHDSLGQKLTGAVFLSRSLLNFFTQKPSDEKAHAKTLNETLKSAVAQVRNMARGLAPVALNDESLGEALDQLAEEMTSLYGVSCEFSGETAARSACPAIASATAEDLALPGNSKSKGGATPLAEPTQREPLKPSSIIFLDQKTKEQLYLIAREAVNNAARHAKAESVILRLTGNEAGWNMRIEDDGQGLPHRRQGYGGQAETQPVEEGLPCSEPGVQGMGIRIMQHRARLIRAKFTITSAPGEGTRIEVHS